MPPSDNRPPAPDHSSDRLRPAPRERMAAAVQHVDISAAAAQLRAEDHPAIKGHRQIALLKRGPLSLVLFTFEPDAELKEHKTNGEVVIQCVSGSLEVTASDQTFQLNPRMLVALAPNEPHSVRALVASEMVLTIVGSGR